LISLAVEAKAGEAFDKTIDQWLKDAKATSGKPARLEHLRLILGIQAQIPMTTRYQLLHRAASAVLEAARFGAPDALLLIQSFASDPNSTTAFAHFGALVGCECAVNAIVEGPVLAGVRLHLGWVDCVPAGTPELEAAV
jgi:hypothetical protein